MVPNFGQFIILHPKLQKNLTFLEKSSFVSFCPLLLTTFQKNNVCSFQENIVVPNFGKFMVLHAKLQKKFIFFKKSGRVKTLAKTAPYIALTSYQISEKSRVPFPSKMWTDGRTDGPEFIGPPGTKKCTLHANELNASSSSSPCRRY